MKCLVYKEHSGPDPDFLPSFLLRPEQRQVCDRPLGKAVGKKVEGMGTAACAAEEAGLGSKPLESNRPSNPTSAFAR